jgi:Ferritin-like
MALNPITSLDDVYTYLYAAMQLEHATIPTYLTALYSIRPGTNIDATQIIRVVTVEEMLHLTLAANMMNAVGGKVDLTTPGFVPDMPTYLPNGETDFMVSRAGFSKSTIEMFLCIERPASTKKDGLLKSGRGLIKRPPNRIALLPKVKSEDEEELHFYSIGEFYEAIGTGLEKICKELGEEKVFSGDPAKQITPEYYYSGGGEIIPVYDLATATAAIRLIAEQGEGFEGEILDYEDEISHYYRFDQLMKGRYYVAGDAAGHPTGEPLQVDWNAAYPVKTNVKLADIPEGSEAHAAAVAFNDQYKAFLASLTDAFDGKPEKLLPAVGDMFHIKNKALELIRNPIPGSDEHAAPTFEVG